MFFRAFNQSVRLSRKLKFKCLNHASKRIIPIGLVLMSVNQEFIPQDVSVPYQNPLFNDVWKTIIPDLEQLAQSIQIMLFLYF